MPNNRLNIIPFKIGSTDKIIFIILFVCLSILPLYPSYMWLSTEILLPTIAVFLFIENKSSKVYADSFFKRFIIIFMFALLSLIPAISISTFSLSDYFGEIKQFLGVIVVFIISIYLLKRNNNNIWPLYLILLSKFVIMVFYTYKSGIISDFDPQSGRLRSGVEVGINENAYGYFTFVALYALGAIMIINKKLTYIILYLTIFLIAVYINILAASRAGFIFTILSAFSIFLVLSFKNWKGLYFKIVIIIIVLALFFVKKIFDFENYVIFQRYAYFITSREDLRIFLLKNGLTLIKQYPFGVGAGQYPSLMANFSNLRLMLVPHNSFILVGTNYGIIPLVIYLSVFHFFIKNSIKIIKSKNILLIQYGILFLTFGILFFFYNFFYDMILNLYIMLMFLLVNLHQNLLISGIIPSISKNK